MRTALACLDQACSLEQDCSLKRECCLHQLAAEIRNYHRSHLRELRFEVMLSGVVIRGVARSYYGKQLALHEIRRRCNLLVTANRIEVEEWCRTPPQDPTVLQDEHDPRRGSDSVPSLHGLAVGVEER